MNPHGKHTMHPTHLFQKFTAHSRNPIDQSITKLFIKTIIHWISAKAMKQITKIKCVL